MRCVGAQCDSSPVVCAKLGVEPLVVVIGALASQMGSHLLWLRRTNNVGL